MSNLDLEKVRLQCNELAARIQAEPAFKAQVLKDPAGVLTAHQLPAEVIPEFLQEVGLAADVQGYTCVLTCWQTY